MSRGMMPWPTHVYKEKVRNQKKYRRKRFNRLRRRFERGGKRVMVSAERFAQQG